MLPAAELFYVAANLSTLVHHAAETLAGYDLHPDDLPARSGFMLFAEPLRDTGAPDPAGAPISLVTWAPMGNSVVIEFWMPTSYAASADPDPVIGFAIPGIARTLYHERHRIPASRRPAQILPAHGYLYQRPTAIPFGGPVDVDYLAQRARATHAHDEGEDCQDCRGTGPASGTARLQRLIVATWLLMGQSITAETRLRPQPTVLGATSAPPTSAEVRYVELRTIKRPPNQASERGESGAGRVYRHSWLVRGLNRTLRRVTNRGEVVFGDYGTLSITISLLTQEACAPHSGATSSSIALNSASARPSFRERRAAP